MNYKNIYYKIIEKAKEENINGKRNIGYFEKHHIQPKSLGGNNNIENLVKLTAREHFICHWLLVKMYNKGTLERNKMLCALWKMQQTPNTNNKRYINSRAYEKLRVEYSKFISLNQTGNKNSQYGSSWYTNRNTGECKKFKTIPNTNCWVKGRNLFNGEYSALYTKIELESINTAKKLWDMYHSGHYSSLRDFCKQIKIITQPALTNMFKKYIPLYKYVFIPRSNKNCSNEKLVGKYYN